MPNVNARIVVHVTVIVRPVRITMKNPVRVQTAENMKETIKKTKL